MKFASKFRKGVVAGVPLVRSHIHRIIQILVVCLTLTASNENGMDAILILKL